MFVVTMFHLCPRALQVVVQVANTSNFICDHQGFCHPNCYERQRRSCARLIMAMQRIYDSGPGDDHHDPPGGATDEHKDDFHSLFRDKLKRRVGHSYFSLDGGGADTVSSGVE